MTMKLVAVGDWRRTLTVLLTLVAVAVLTTAAAPAPARAATKNTPVLAQGAGMGSKPSAAVRRVQRVLRSRGYSLGRPGVDGRFGPLTGCGRPAAAGRPRAGRRRHRRPQDPQGRARDRAPRAAALHDAQQQLAHQAAGAEGCRHAAGGPDDGGDGERQRSRLARSDRSRAGGVRRGSRARPAQDRPPAESAGGHRAARPRALPRGPQRRRRHRALPRARAGHDGRRGARQRPQPGTDVVPPRRSHASRRRSGSARTTSSGCRRAFSPERPSSAT